MISFNIFPTILQIKDLSEHKDLNRRLIEDIEYQMSFQDPNDKSVEKVSSFTKNPNSWASIRGMQKHYESFDELGQILLEEAEVYKDINLWANVIKEPGGFSRPHFHGRTHKLTGVYYPNGLSDATFPDVIEDGFTKEEGSLILFDPKATTHNETKSIKHVEGLLVFFPVYLQHMVSPMISNRRRYCISFNFK